MTKQSENPNPTARKYLSMLWWICPILACFAGWTAIADWFDHPIQHDAQVTYLPAAHAFMEQGWHFLLTPESYHVVPLAYLWPALWGADPTLIRTANAGLWAGCIFFLWQSCRLLEGYRAGLIGMILLGTHPELRRYFPTELTEPVFLFGIFGWIYAVANILIKDQVTWWMVLFGSAMLTITLLSRPVMQLLAPVCLIICLACLAYWKLRKQPPPSHCQSSLTFLSWSLSLGLILPIALILKNGLVFGLWGLGTGSGAGLYLGTHPLTQGTEPAFLGFHYDVNSFTTLTSGDSDHLTIASDRALRDAAIWQTQSTSLTDGLAFFGRKLWWWLAHHPAQIDAFGSALRKIRFFELLVLIVAVTSVFLRGYRHINRRHPILPNTSPSSSAEGSQWLFRAFLLAMFLGMLGQLLPVLYNSRYSSALLDPWLIPLAAWGFAYLTAPIQLQSTLGRHGWSLGMKTPAGTPFWQPVAMLFGILTLTFAGYNFARTNEQIAPDPMHMGKVVSHLDISASERAEVYGMTATGDRSWMITKSPAALQIRIDQADVDHITAAGILNALWKTDIALNAKERCGKTDISYRTLSDRILQPAYKQPLQLPLKADGAIHTIVTHANDELRPQEPGSLRIVLRCPVGTEVQWKNTQLLESSYFKDVAAHVKPSLVTDN
ncbi:MAG: hypothetical protein WBC18_21470 [Ottowia sp.]|uniref:hypothetical protein n=1 Tax=Ottowia sp. TaxID=1898956 RepID=UPI003C76089F